MFDHTLYNFKHGNGDAAWQLRVYFNIETIVRGYLAYQSVWVAVSKNCHAIGSKLACPEDLFCHCSDDKKTSTACLMLVLQDS